MEKDYEVICTLGEGSFGKVYKARHRRLGDEVAVKQIKIGSRSWDEACRSTELQALKALRHPFIVKLKELIRGQKDGSLYYIFEFLDSDLCRLLKYNSNGLEELRAAALMRQLFAGLAHMHQHNFFHRDIKPENILLDVASETIRLADFGQARSLRARPPFTDYVGTRWYRAPECLLRDRSYSSPVDIWACGLIFAELLRGSPVFCGNSSIDQLYKIFTVLTPPTDWPDFAKLTQALRFRVPDRSCGLVRVVPQCTSKCVGFLTEILALNPRRRPLAKKCLEHMYFSNLPALDLERLDTASQAQMQSSMNVDNEQSDTSQFQSIQSVLEDVSEDKPPISDERIQSKHSAFSIRNDLTKDLDLDAELDAILGDDKPSPASSPPRGFTRAATLPNLPSDSPAKNLTHAGSFESLPSTRHKAADEYNAEASTVATPEDHLDRLLESLDNEETTSFDDDTVFRNFSRNENTRSPEEVEVERLAAERKAELDRLEAEAAEAVAKAEAQRLEEEAIAKAAKRVAAERAAKAEADRRRAEAAAKAEEAERLAQAEREALAKAEAQRLEKEAAAKAEALRVASEKAAKIAAEKRAAEAAAKAEIERIAAKTAKAKADHEAEVERSEAEAVSTLDVERIAGVEVEKLRPEAFAKLDAERENDFERSVLTNVRAEAERVPSDVHAQAETKTIKEEAIREGDIESLPAKMDARQARAQVQFHRSFSAEMPAVIPSDSEDKLEFAPSEAQEPPMENKSSDLELEQLRAENATLKELLGSKASGTAFDLRNASTTVGETGGTIYYAMDAGESSKASLKSKPKPWAADEAKLLRRVVKRIIRKGTRDKVALWTEVSLEMGGARSAKECKDQYKRDYLAHKAKDTEAADAETVP